MLTLRNGVDSRKGDVMRQKGNRTKTSKETETNRITKIELALKEIESELKRATLQLEAQAQRIRETERRISGQIIDLQKQIREKAAPGLDPDGLITLEEGTAVDLEELEKKMEEKCSLLTVRERELQDLQKRMSAEFENLKAEIRERELLLAAREMEVKSLKQTMGARIEELENLAKNQAGGMRRTNRLVSFLVDIGKKH